MRMITEFDLYPKERKRLAPEQITSLMLTNIDIEPIGDRSPQRDINSFRISFTTESPLVAQRVTSSLTALFINEHLRTQEEQSVNTTKFLHDQVEAKRRKHDEQEQLLRDFKLRHVGELPEQQQGNLGILGGLQAQLQNTMTALNRAHQQQAYLRSLIDSYSRRADNTATPSLGNPSRPLTPLETAQNELAQLEATRQNLLGK